MLFYKLNCLMLNSLMETIYGVSIILCFIKALNRALNNFSLFTGNKYGHRLKYLAIALNTTVKPDALSYEDGLPIHDEWEDFVTEQVR